jgi:hypothetical protein
MSYNSETDCKSYARETDSNTTQTSNTTNRNMVELLEEEGEGEEETVNFIKFVEYNINDENQRIKVKEIIEGLYNKQFNSLLGLLNNLENFGSVNYIETTSDLKDDLFRSFLNQLVSPTIMERIDDNIFDILYKCLLSTIHYGASNKQIKGSFQWGIYNNKGYYFVVTNDYKEICLKAVNYLITDIEDITDKLSSSRLTTTKLISIIRILRFMTEVEKRLDDSAKKGYTPEMVKLLVDILLYLTDLIKNHIPHKFINLVLDIKYKLFKSFDLHKFTNFIHSLDELTIPIVKSYVYGSEFPDNMGTSSSKNGYGKPWPLKGNGKSSPSSCSGASSSMDGYGKPWPLKANGKSYPSSGSNAPSSMDESDTDKPLPTNGSGKSFQSKK